MKKKSKKQGTPDAAWRHALRFAQGVPHLSPGKPLVLALDEPFTGSSQNPLSRDGLAA